MQCELSAILFLLHLFLCYEINTVGRGELVGLAQAVS
jgi:hypothetical protein